MVNLAQPESAGSTGRPVLMGRTQWWVRAVVRATVVPALRVLVAQLEQSGLLVVAEVAERPRSWAGLRPTQPP